MPLDFLVVIKESREELRNTVKNRDAMEKRISQLVVTLRAMSRFLPDPAQRQTLLDELKKVRRRPPTLTEAITKVLRDADDALNSNEIREELENNGFDLSEYSQALAVIMTTLKRLEEDSHVKRHKHKERGVTFKWVGPPEDFK